MAADAVGAGLLLAGRLLPLRLTIGTGHRLTVRPGAASQSTWDLRGSDHWYDLTVSLENDPTFIQRLAGHVETGRPSRTDPAIGRMRL